MHVAKPGEKIGIGEYSIAVEDERVEQSVEAFGDGGVEHEVDGVVLADWMIVVRHRELDQLHAAAAAAVAAHPTVRTYTSS